jgi:outer membrane protein insertion porin family
VLSAGAEAGYIFGFGDEDIRVNDRFFLGEPRLRGFDIRGVGPRSLRAQVINNVPITDREQIFDDALGGNAYYLGRLELELPLGSSGRELGLRPSLFADVGGLWDTGPQRGTRRVTTNSGGTAITFEESVVGDTWKPRVSVGGGVSWNSPFGPFRIDVAKALVKRDGDDTQLFQFNVGTQF